MTTQRRLYRKVTLAYAFILAVMVADAMAMQTHTLFPQNDSRASGTLAGALRPVPPDSLKDFRARGEGLIRQQRLNEALLVYRRIAFGAPDDLGAVITLADLYSWTGDYDHAIALYRDVIDHDAVNLAGLKGLARVMRWATRYADAERYYATVLSIEPDDLDGLMGLAQTFAQQRNLERALGYVERANRIAPNKPEILLTKGDILAWGNQFKAAEESYNLVLKLDPASSQAWKSLGDLYGWAGRPSSAVEMLHKAHRLDPRNPDILIKLGNVALDAGMIPQAEDAVKALFTIDPNNMYGFDILRRIELRQSVDYAALVDVYAKPLFLVLSNVVIALYFRSRKDRLRRRGGPYWRLAYYVWPVLALLWLGIFLITRTAGISYFAGFTEIAEFVTLIVWMLAFVTLAWTSRVQQESKRAAVLAIGAHPDDIELGCGGTLSRYKELGYQVYGLVLTRGEAGNPLANEKLDRRDEAERGATILGLDGLQVCDFKDTGLANQINEMKNVIEEMLRRTGAGIIITQSPHDIHQDHKAVFEATKIAARGDKSLLCYEDVSTEAHFAANYFVDISDYMSDKIKAVGAHRTQRQKPYMSPDNVTGRALHRGLQTGVRYAEAFLLYKGVDLWPS
jgi:LmbE family N-acetylglucosaminyl deacetylase/tetratricopeptide (TPR) repeat protein